MRIPIILAVANAILVNLYIITSWKIFAIVAGINAFAFMISIGYQWGKHQ